MSLSKPIIIIVNYYLYKKKHVGSILINVGAILYGGDLK